MGTANSTTRQDQINALLPSEVLHQIFRLLAPRDLKASVLVCQWWREVWEVQSLWSWVGLRVTRENQTDMFEFLKRWTVSGGESGGGF